jgi:radical SAM superfamily enzyme YgiQ (UPF0313 family)
MRILLINSNRFRHPWPVIPFGLCSVAASLTSAGHEIKVLDLCFSKRPALAIATAVMEFQPALVGISIRNIDNGTGYKTVFLLEETRREVIIPCRDHFSGPIVIGGPAVSINTEEVLELLDLRYAVRGDGEQSMVEIARKVELGQRVSGISGLAVRENGKVVETNPPARSQDLDQLPVVRPHRFIDIRPYRQFDSPLQVQTKRGCSLHCVYCTYNKVEGRRYRLRSPDRVAGDIGELVKETGVNHIEFTDSTFNIPLDHSKAVLRALASKRLDLRLRTMGLNPGSVDEELVDLMKAAGFVDVDLGAESGSNEILRTLGKNYSKEDLLRAGSLLRSRKIPTTWYLILGAPGETRQTMHETFDTMDKAVSPWDMVVLGLGLRVYKGTPLAGLMSESGLAGPRDNFLRPVSYSPVGLSLDEIAVMAEQAVRSYPNYYCYASNLDFAPWLKVSAKLRNIFPRQPIWRAFILVRSLLKLCGLDSVPGLPHGSSGESRDGHL